LLLTIERSSEVRNNSTNLVCCPEPYVLPAGLLQEVSMPWVEADTAHIAVRARGVILAFSSSSGDPIVIVAGRLEIPVTRAYFCVWVLGSWGSALIGRRALGVAWSERNRHVDPVDDLHVIEINARFDHGDFSLRGWLHEALARFAALVPTAAVSCLASGLVAIGPSCEDSTPDDFGSVIVDWDLHVLRRSRLQFIAAVLGLGVVPEALAYGSCLDTARSLVAIAVRPTGGALRVPGSG